MQNNQEDQLSIDELINIFNAPKNKQTYSSEKQVISSGFDIGNKYLPPIQSKGRVISISKNVNTVHKTGSYNQKSMMRPKTLVFKPWSGQYYGNAQMYGTNDTNAPIKQEIQKLEDSDQQNQSHKQDEIIQDTKTISASTGANQQLGYLYKFQAARVRLIKCLLDQNGFKEGPNNRNWTIYWSSNVIKPDIYQNLMPYQKVNHFPNSFHLTRKDLMNKSISKMQEKFGGSHFNFLPKTYILPQQMDQLLTQMNKNTYTYIVKPHNRSQGKGITVTSSLQVIYSKLQKYSSLIVSHYIDNPLLINRLKFDLRIYVALTSINPLRIYVFQQGLARFATQEYDESCLNTENKKYQHLTNYSVNKKNAEYVASNAQNQEYYGSKWRLTALKDFLSFNIGKNQAKDLFDRIDDVLIKTIISGQNTLYSAFNNNVPFVNGCFQVYGFDIMIDSNLKPWLIQVNMSPSLNTDSTLDLKIKGNMIADLFTMIGIVPLGQRYLDGGHTKYQIRHYIKPDNARIQQGAVQKFILKETQLQHQRSGDWRRVFPSASSSRYKNYFDKDRYFNRLLRENLAAPKSIQSFDPHPTRGYSSIKTETIKDNVRGYSSNKPKSNNSIGSAGVRIINRKKVVTKTRISKQNILY